MRLPSLKTVRKSRFVVRLQFLKTWARKLFLKTPNSITLKKAVAIFEHFCPLFGAIELHRISPPGSWALKVKWLQCPDCRLEFDEIDVGSTRYGDGWVHCPKCAEQVVEKKKGKG